MNHAFSELHGKSFRDNDQQFISFVKLFVNYCKKKEQLVDEIIEALDPDDAGELDIHIFIQRCANLGIKLSEEDINHFLQCLELEQNVVDLNKLFDEINKRMFIEDSKYLKTAFF